jgi:hypothetical protein
MDDMLLGYLCNALEPDEVREVEARLDRDPRLHDRLTELKKSLAPLALDVDAAEPPPRLVLTTLARVAEDHCCRSTPASPAVRHVPTQEYAPTRPWFRRADVLVAAVLLVIVGGLGVPWVVRLWHESQIVACQRNLTVFWTALERHANMHGGDFPRLDENGPGSFAGIFVPTLNDNKALASEATILCPAVGKRAPDGRSVRELTQLWEQDGATEFRAVIRDVGGNYAFPLGYWDGPRLIGLHSDDGDNTPLMADALGIGNRLGNSDNHGGRGQNVLFVGGNVRWSTMRRIGPEGDDIYVNKNNEVGAGLCREDVVLGVGDASPCPCPRR